MSRLIDADALFDAMEETEWYNNADRDEIAERLIMDAPSIDIVRCRECSNRMTDDCPMCNGCKLDRVPTEDDDFCSYGEKERVSDDRPDNG